MNAPFRRLVGGPVASNYDIALHDKKRARPWKVAEYEAVRQAAMALLRTHLPLDVDEGTLPTFDGKALWRLMDALDRGGR